MKYIRLTQEATAEQFTKENLDNFLELIFGEKDPDVEFTDEMKDEIIKKGFGIQTPNGDLSIRENDWLVIDNGKFIVYSDKEFLNSFMTKGNLN